MSAANTTRHRQQHKETHLLFWQKREEAWWKKSWNRRFNITTISSPSSCCRVKKLIDSSVLSEFKSVCVVEQLKKWKKRNDIASKKKANGIKGNWEQQSGMVRSADAWWWWSCVLCSMRNETSSIYRETLSRTTQNNIFPFFFLWLLLIEKHPSPPIEKNIVNHRVAQFMCAFRHTQLEKNIH